ncbi:hypothetical protein N2152v2_000031 [Parachlorella kessleri]
MPSCHASCEQGAESIDLFTGNKMTVYQKMVLAGHHDHSLTARLLNSLLCQHFGRHKGLRLLDLGCGDASFAASILNQGDTPLSLSSYTGVDLSATSLQLAAQQPLPLPAGNGSSSSRRLVEQDMLGFLRAWQEGQQAQQEAAQQLQQGEQEGEGEHRASTEHAQQHGAHSRKHQLRQQQEPQLQAAPVAVAPASPPGEAYDVVLCALSAHHLARHEKQQLLCHARCALARGGCLLLMDVFRKEGESRDAYMERARHYYFEDGGQGSLRPEEAEEVWAHVSVYDYPETESDYRHMAAEAGFARCKLLHTCRREYTKVLALWRD